MPNDTHVVYGPRVNLTLVPPPAEPLEPRPELRAERWVGRTCVRPGCSRRATTTLRFDYAERAVMLDPLGVDATPGEYDLCLRHAARCTPPTGWTLRDRAPSPDSATESAPPVGPDRGPAVARLAAALSAVEGTVSEDAPDAAPLGTDRPVAATRPTTRLDGLLRPSSPAADAAAPHAVPHAAPHAAPQEPPATPEVRIRPVPLSERLPEAEVRPVPQPLRLAPDPTTTVWCADLLGTTGGPAEDATGGERADATERAGATERADEAPAAGATLFS